MVQYWSQNLEAGKDFDSKEGKLTSGELKDWELLREKRRNWEDWLHSKGKRKKPASRKLDDVDTEDWQ